MLHGLGVGVGRAHQRSLHHTNLRAQTKPYIQLGPALASAGAGSDGWQTANRLDFLWWLRLCEGLWMATNAAQAQASSASGQGRASSAADDPPDPSAAWYMTKAQLEKTPARKALLQKFGQDAEKAKEKEAQYRRLTVGFLQEAGQKLRLCVPRPARGLSAPFPGSSHGGGAEALTPGRARSA